VLLYSTLQIVLAGLALAAGVIALPTASRADAVLDWNDELLTVIQQTSSLLVDGPPEVAREMSIVDSAMFDAANAAAGLAYPSIAPGMTAASNASVDAAALSAGYTAMQGIFSNVIWTGNPTNSALTIGSQTVPSNSLAIGYGGSTAVQSQVLSEISSLYTTDLASLGNGSSVTNGVNLGVVAGNENLSANGYCVTSNGGAGSCLSSSQIAASSTAQVNSAAYATDGSAASILQGLQPNAPSGSGTTPGVYVPPTTRPEMFPQWGTVTPVGGLSSSNISTIVSQTIPGPPAIGTTAYSSALLETECEGSGQPLASLPANVQSACAAAGYTQETPALAASALFWNDPGTTIQPPGHWLQIAETVAQSQGLGSTPASELQEARETALVSEAEDDAGIAVWGVKYTSWNGIGPLWRPVTAITSCGSGTASWNPNFTSCDPTWSSLIATPPHPDYAAGHPAFSAAAATVLENFFGTDDVSFSSTSNSYCNGGGSTTVRSDSAVTIVACTVPATSAFAYDGLATIYSMDAVSGTSNTDGCTAAGGTLGSAVVNTQTLTTCTLGSNLYYYNPTVTGCNDIVDGGSNDSPLICPITQSYDSFSEASDGLYGAGYSRVVGGIHTPFSVEDATGLGNAIGEQLSADNNIPEPASLLLLGASAATIGWLRRRRTGSEDAVASADLIVFSQTGT
jgi:hypothetical protein